MTGLRDAVEAVASERVRGSSWALSTIARGVVEEVESGGSIDCVEAPKMVEGLVRGMSVLSLAASIMRQLCGDSQRLASVMRSLMQYIEEASEGLAGNAAGELPQGAVTAISMSRAVFRALVSARPERVYVLESRPGGEGVVMARMLRQTGVDVQVVPDSAMAWALGRSSAAVMGGDSASLYGCIVNKVGSYPLAVAAKSMGVKVLALLESYKVSESDYCRGGFETRTYRVDGWGDVVYEVFEPVPFGEIDLIVTERRSYPPDAGLLREDFEAMLSEVMEGF